MDRSGEGKTVKFKIYFNSGISPMKCMDAKKEREVHSQSQRPRIKSALIR